MLITVFSPGRTGTGYLSQIFGGEYSKRAMHINKDALVTHESWSEIKFLIKKIKEVGYTEEINEKINKVINQKLRNIQEEYEVQKYFITDHRIGRFLLRAYDGDFKIIRIKRNTEDIVASLVRRINIAKDKHEVSTFNGFFNQLWSMSFYSPDDLFINHQETLSKWNTLSLEDTLEWYVEETNRQWSIQKSKFKDRYIEVLFENLFDLETVQKISDFIEIPYLDKYISKRVNK